MIDNETVEKVAKLSRLHLEEGESQQFANQLSSILDIMEDLQKIDVTRVEPLAHVLPIKNVFREDEIEKCFPPEIVLANAPEQDENMFRVPKIV